MRQLYALSFLLALMIPVAAWAQPQVESGLTMEEYVNEILLGSGVTAFNITYTGSDVQIGHLTGAENTIFPLTEGLVLSSAEAANIASEDCFAGGDVPWGEGVSGDADLLDIANSVPPLIGQNFSVSSVNDLCILEFDFIATGDTVKFNYSFGSDEYLEWVNSSFNDIFGFFLSGPGIVGPYDSPAGFPDGSVNIAQLPDTDPPLPITISSVNDQLNSEYYIDNPSGEDLCIDGFTTKLEAFHLVECGETYHIKLAIADGSDTALESVVVLEAGSFTSNSVVDVDLTIDVGNYYVDQDIIYEDCGEALITFTRPLVTVLEIEEMIIINYEGIGVNGEDYTLLPDTVIFPPGVESVQFPVDAFIDGVDEGVELVTMEILNLAACSGGGLTSYFEFYIGDTPEPLQVDDWQTTICQGDTLELIPVISGGYGNFNYDWSTGETSPTITVSPEGTESFNVMISDTCGMPSDDADMLVEILVFPPLEISIDGGDLVLDCGESVQLNATTSGGDGIYSWFWEDQDGNNLWGWQNTLWYSTWQGADQVVVTVEDGCGFESSDVINVELNVPELIVDLEEEMSVLCNTPFIVGPEVSGGQNPYWYNWYNGGMWIGWEQNINWTTSEDVVLTVEVQDNCGQIETADVSIVVDSPPVEIELEDEMTGSCIEVFELDPEITSGSGGYTYSWTNVGEDLGSTSSIDFQSDNSTVIDLTVDDQCGASASTQVIINIVNPPLEVEIGEDINASCVDNTEIVADILSGSGGYEYEWTVGGEYAGNNESVFVQSFQTIPVFLSVIDACGGATQDQLTYFIPDIPIEMTITDDQILCFGDGVSLEALATGGEEGFVYHWPQLSSYGPDQYITPLNTATYEVVATDICGESVTQDVTVEVQFLFSNFYATYLSDTEVQFTANPEPECESCIYEWNFGDGATSEEVNPLHEYDGLSEYTASLTVTSDIGCTDSAYTLIHAPVLLYVPNAFTPNNDGINDVFKVVGDQISRYEITIFDRWGEIVFKSNSLDEVWTGSNNYSEHYVEDGIYTYVIKVKGFNTDAFEKVGNINVMR